MKETQVLCLGQEDPLEKELATHRSILAWRIPCTEEPDRLQSTTEQLTLSLFPGGKVLKNLPAISGDTGDDKFDPRLGKSIPWRRKW